MDENAEKIPWMSTCVVMIICSSIVAFSMVFLIIFTTDSEYFLIVLIGIIAIDTPIIMLISWWAMKRTIRRWKEIHPKNKEQSDELRTYD